jgi:YD repeat-containing protein
VNSSTSYAYGLWDDARVWTSTYDSDTGSGSNPLFTSTYSYDGLGRLASVSIADGRPRTVTFTNNPNGQVLSRIESSAAASNPADYYYFVDGVQIGEVSNASLS